MQSLSIDVADEAEPEPGAEPELEPPVPSGTPSSAHVAPLPPQPPSPRFPINKPSRKAPVGRSGLGKLPAFTSADWEFEEMELPPGPKDKK